MTVSLGPVELLKLHGCQALKDTLQDSTIEYKHFEVKGPGKKEALGQKHF